MAAVLTALRGGALCGANNRHIASNSPKLNSFLRGSKKNKPDNFENRSICLHSQKMSEKVVIGKGLPRDGARSCNSFRSKKAVTVRHTTGHNDSGIPMWLAGAVTCVFKVRAYPANDKMLALALLMAVATHPADAETDSTAHAVPRTLLNSSRWWLWRTCWRHWLTARRWRLLFWWRRNRWMGRLPNDWLTKSLTGVKCALALA